MTRRWQGMRIAIVSRNKVLREGLRLQIAAPGGERSISRICRRAAGSTPS